MRVQLREQIWDLVNQVHLGDRRLFDLRHPVTGEQIQVLCPPDNYELLTEAPPQFDRSSYTPFGIWRTLHDALRLAAPPDGKYVAFYAGRIVPEAYQFAPLARLLNGPRRSLLIADDVGLGKTVEAGICLLELIARGVGRRILLVVPPGLIPQWLDEMWDKFGLEFRAVENSVSLDRAQTELSEGLSPWAYFDRVITSTEYLKRRDVCAAALAHSWDVVVADEAHYLAESGTPANPYSTARTRLGPRLRQASRSLILLTATPHNGYRHSFRSLIELVDPAGAALYGRPEDIQRRVARTMIRRLKPQITRRGISGEPIPAFPVRLPVRRISVEELSAEEKEIFRLISAYCARTVQAAVGSNEADLVSFAMQIVKKRMLSSRAALRETVSKRLQAITARTPEEPPARHELRELEADLPVTEALAERTAERVLRAAVARDAKRRGAEKRQLKAVAQLLEQVDDRPDPKITTLIRDLERDVLQTAGEKAIVFTEYRDTLSAIRQAFVHHPILSKAFVELTGGLSPAQRKARIAAFYEAECRVLIATDAASEGLNLQERCCRLYHFELPWNPNRLEQRNGRIDRHGQERSPDIRYLFYPETPEDHVLDRLVQRISQMHGDRVSTPDILGIIEGSRIEDILVPVDSAEAGEVAAQSLMKLFDSRHEEFANQISPLLIGGPDSESLLPFANAVSADPLLEDDGELERFMQEALHGALTPALLPGTWRIDVPRQFRGPAVETRYPSATFRRSVAARHSATDVEFVHRLHPLFRAVVTHGLEQLTLEPLRNISGSRIAARRHPRAMTGPFVIFTYLERDTHPLGRVFAVGADANGRLVQQASVDEALSDGQPGEVPWAEIEGTFSGVFRSAQETAAKVANGLLQDVRARQREQRARAASILRDEAALFRVDRLAELDDDERLERAGTRDQMELFRETATNWQARRAAVETHYRNRLEEIERYADVPEPGDPQPLGVLFVFPPA